MFYKTKPNLWNSDSIHVVICHLSQCACRLFSLIWLSLLLGIIPVPMSPVYCATKHAVVGYTRSWAVSVCHSKLLLLAMYTNNFKIRYHMRIWKDNLVNIAKKKNTGLRLSVMKTNNTLVYFVLRLKYHCIYFQANPDMKNEGIRFNTLCPSFTDTDLVRNIQSGDVINPEWAKEATKQLGLMT